MRSIIDEIAAAEAQAEQIKQSAAASSRDLIAKAKADCEKTLTDLETQERDATRDALVKADADGKVLADKLQKQIAAEADVRCSAAGAKLGAAVEYLVKKVQESA